MPGMFERIMELKVLLGSLIQMSTALMTAGILIPVM